VDHPVPPKVSGPASPPAKKAEVRKRAEFEKSMARLRRIRTLIGLLGFVPLFASLACPGIGAGLCALPREVFLLAWAAIFGSFLGLTLRMWRERRAFNRGAAAAA